MLNSEGKSVTMPDECRDDLLDLIDMVKSCKPNDRSGVDRHYAVVITELEKVVAYFDYYIMPHAQP